MNEILDNNYGLIESIYTKAVDGKQKIVLRQHQDVEPILENNKRLRNEAPVNPYHKREFVRTASIPLNTIHKWVQEAGLDWAAPTIWRDLETIIAKKKKCRDWEAVRTIPRKWRG